MHIKPEVSTLTEWFEITDDAGTAQIKLPVVDTSNAETDVLVEDGRTIIIAGLIRETSREYEDKIPLLGDVPLLGKLFKSTTKSKENKELVIFLTPHIIAGDETVASLEEKYSEKENSDQDYLEEEYSEEDLFPEEKQEGQAYKEVRLEDNWQQPQKQEQEDVFYYKLGFSYEQDEDYQQAIKEYEQALYINPRNTLAHLHLANIYGHHIIDFQKADYHFRWYKILARGSTE